MVEVCLVVNTKLSGKRLHTAIKKSGYSIRELQEMLTLSCPNPIYRWIHGEALPSTVNLYRLSYFLQVPMESLLAVEQWFQGQIKPDRPGILYNFTRNPGLSGADQYLLQQIFLCNMHKKAIMIIVPEISGFVTGTCMRVKYFTYPLFYFQRKD